MVRGMVWLSFEALERPESVPAASRAKAGRVWSRRRPAVDHFGMVRGMARLSFEPLGRPEGAPGAGWAKVDRV
jgi:hypothetical protein